MLEAVLAYAQTHVEDMTPDEVESVISRIETLTQMISVASEQASEEHQVRLARANVFKATDEVGESLLEAYHKAAEWVAQISEKEPAAAEGEKDDKSSL